MKRILKSALVALAAIAMLAPQIKAATTAYNAGDVLLGFRDNTGASSNDYMIDVGQYSSFPTTGGTTFSLGNVAADMVAAFGNTWYTSGNIVFSAFGINTANSIPTFFYLTNPNNAGMKNLTSGNVGSFTNYINNVTGGQYSNEVSGSSPYGLVESKSATYSYSAYQYGGTYSATKYWNLFSVNPECSITGTNYLTLFTVSGGIAPTSAVEGTFTVNSLGNITYTAPTPEPTTLACLAVGGMMVASTMRRRKA